LLIVTAIAEGRKCARIVNKDLGGSPMDADREMLAVGVWSGEADRTLRHEAEAWFRVGGTLGAVPTRYYDRGALKAGNRLEGPAIVNQYDSTTVIPPGLAGRVDRFGGIVIETGAASLADVLVAAVEEVEP